MVEHITINLPWFKNDISSIPDAYFNNHCTKCPYNTMFPIIIPIIIPIIMFPIAQNVL